MSRLEIDQNKSNFLLDGEPFFYLADTIWSAFTNVTLEEWEYYLKKRKEQGFNVLQINTMPQWDRCMSDTGLYPFAMDERQKLDYTRWNDSYYENAREMCRMAVKYDFQLALVVLWLNYVPGTWGSKINKDNVMPKDFVEEYTRRVVTEFDEFQPIYVISGDTDFKTPESLSYYRTALRVVCERSPNTLKTLHICRANEEIPEEFLEQIDFYMFQSGHNRDGQDMAYILPERFHQKYPKKPMINAEPCYEQMGYSRGVYGRFKAEDTRRAAWSSILSGACAGVAYGAHGIWNWQKVNKQVNPNIGEGFDRAFPWEEAIRFTGAWNFGWIRQLLQELGVREIVDSRELLEHSAQEIRLGADLDETYLLYLPHTTKIVLKKELSGYTVRAFDLEHGRCAVLDFEIREGKTVIEQHPFYNDALLVMELGK